MSVLLLLVVSCNAKPPDMKTESPDPMWDEMVRRLATNEDNLYPGYKFYEGKNRREARKTTIMEKLQEIGAYLKNGKVFDQNGKELYFYLVNEWTVTRRGLDHSDGSSERRPIPGEEIRALQKQYHVIPMYVGQGPRD